MCTVAAQRLISTFNQYIFQVTVIYISIFHFLQIYTSNPQQMGQILYLFTPLLLSGNYNCKLFSQFIPIKLIMT